MGRKSSRRLKEKALGACVVSTSTYGLVTVAMSEQQQRRILVQARTTG